MTNRTAKEQMLEDGTHYVVKTQIEEGVCHSYSNTAMTQQQGIKHAPERNCLATFGEVLDLMQNTTVTRDMMIGGKIFMTATRDIRSIEGLDIDRCLFNGNHVVLDIRSESGSVAVGMSEDPQIKYSDPRLKVHYLKIYALEDGATALPLWMPNSAQEENTKGAYLYDLSGGHSVLAEDYAKKICETFGVPYDEKLCMQYDDAYSTIDGKMGVKGVADLKLLYYLAESLEISTDNPFVGAGAQARCVAGRIAEKLGITVGQ